MDAVAASGFQLNTNAQQLKQVRSQNIIILVKGSSNQLFGMLVEAIQRRMVGCPYHLMVEYLDEDQNEVLRALQLCRERKPRGLLFLGGNRRHFAENFQHVHVPAVLVTNDGSGLPFDNLSSVFCNDTHAVQEAMEQMIASGHRKFAIIGGDRSLSDTTLQRYQGCMAAFNAHGIEFDPDLDYKTVRFSYGGGYRGAKELIQQRRDYTAIFCMADAMAMGAIRALSDEGLRIPEDVSVVGFDGLPIGDFIVPRLSTISQSIEELAERSVDLLITGIEGAATSVHETVPAKLNWRESTKPV
jgi:LacI family transcriptional regulator